MGSETMLSGVLRACKSDKSDISDIGGARVASPIPVKLRL
jgi:hypothetical protein